MKGLWRHPGVQIGLLTLIGIGAYAGIRSIPTYNCGFLHAGQPVRISTSPNDDFCEVEGNRFVDLQTTRYAVTATVEREEAEGAFTLTLNTSTGRPVRYDEIAISHDARIHLLVIDESLGIYHHVHPFPTETPGTYLFGFPAREGHTYRMIAEFVHRRAMSQVVAETLWNSDSSPISTRYAIQPVATSQQTRGNRLLQEHDNHQFELILPFQGLLPNQENEVLLRISHLDRQPVDLQPLMGAKAHLVAFDYGGRGFAHFHPIEGESESLTDSDTFRPLLPFTFEGLRPGSYRLWVQVRLGDEEALVPFDFEVQPESLASAN